MKKIFFSVFAFITISSFAQPTGGGQDPTEPTVKNIFLTASFWKTGPDVNAVKAEIAKGNSPTEMNDNAFDPVVMALINSAPNESIIYLIEQGGNEINKLTHDSRTYIFWAAYKGNIEVMKYVLSKGAKTDLEDSHGLSPLLFAANAGEKNIEVYELLIANGANPKKELTPDGANALLLSIGSDLALAEYFESKGLKKDSKDINGNNAFDYAARTGNIEIMKKLYAKGIKPTNNAMALAAMGTRRSVNGIEVFKYIESLGIKPSATSNTGANALHYLAYRSNQEELINYFLSKGTDVNQQDKEGNTVFMNAAAFNTNLAIMEKLAATVKDFNLANKSGETALALAVNNNTPEIVKYLLEKGANVNAIDAKGNNLAYNLIASYRTAYRRGSPQNAQGAATQEQDEFDEKLILLKEKGFDVATPQKDGNTLFHLAIAKNSLDLFKKIEPLGADINAVNNDGFTALHKAAMISKNAEILKFLISLGAKKDIKTEFDETAYELAANNEFLSKKNISIDFLK